MNVESLSQEALKGDITCYIRHLNNWVQRMSNSFGFRKVFCHLDGKGSISYPWSSISNDVYRNNDLILSLSRAQSHHILDIQCCQISHSSPCTIACDQYSIDLRSLLECLGHCCIYISLHIIPIRSKPSVSLTLLSYRA